MKNFHQNVLIILAVSLCGLCVWQWYGQTKQRNRIENLNKMLVEKSTATQGYTNTIETQGHQIEQMDATITALKSASAAVAATNEQVTLAQKREITRLQRVTEVMTNEITQYTNAVATLEAKLQELAEGVKNQNTAIAELVTQRDDFIQKLNDSIKDRNAIVEKYNDLVKQIDKANGTGNKGN